MRKNTENSQRSRECAPAVGGAFVLRERGPLPCSDQDRPETGMRPIPRPAGRNRSKTHRSDPPFGGFDSACPNQAQRRSTGREPPNSRYLAVCTGRCCVALESAVRPKRGTQIRRVCSDDCVLIWRKAVCSQGNNARQGKLI